MKLKFLLDLLECAFTVMDTSDTVLYQGNKYNIDGHNPKLKERIVVAVYEDFEIVIQ